VAAYSGASPRTGTLTLAGKTFTVSQDGTSCPYSLSPESQSFDFSGGSGVVNVNSSTDCSWTARSNVRWIVLSDEARSSRSGVVNYTVLSNRTSSRRTGLLIIGEKTFQITQEEAKRPEISVEPALVDFGDLVVGRQSSARVRISNAGSAPLVIQYTAIVGVFQEEFGESQECPALSPGSFCEVTVTFAPSREGDKRAGLQIRSNDPNRKRVRVDLRGRAVLEAVER
jgi:hypothetical protein